MITKPLVMDPEHFLGSCLFVLPIFFLFNDLVTMFDQLYFPLEQYVWMIN